MHAGRAARAEIWRPGNRKNSWAEPDDDLAGKETQSGAPRWALPCGASGGAGADFTLTAGALTFAAGETAKLVLNTIINDALSEASETIVVTLSNPSGAVLGANVTYTYTITELPINAWRFANFGASANNPLIAGDLADPDLDALPNLLEFALASDPLNPEVTSLPVIAIEGPDATLTYTRPVAVGDVTFSIEKWNAPDSWSAEPFTESILSDDGTYRVVKDHIPLNGATQMMLRLRVSRPAP